MKKMMKWCAAALMAVVMIAPVSAQDNGAKRFDDTVRYLDKGGLVLEYLDAGTVVNNISGILFKLLDQYCVTEDELLVKKIVKDIVKQSGLTDIRGYGSSLAIADKTYTVKNFLGIDPQKAEKNLLCNVTAGDTASTMEKFIMADDVVALAGNINGTALWNLIDTNVKKYITDPQNQAQYAMLMAQIQVFTGMPAADFCSSFKGAGAFVKLKKKADGTHDIPAFTVLIDMENKAVCDKLVTQLTILNPEMIKDGKIIFPIPEINQMITIGVADKYIYVTNDAGNIAARLAQKDSAVKLTNANAKLVSWLYIAPGLDKELIQFLEKCGKLDDPREKKIVLSIIESLNLNASFTVSCSRVPEGFLTVSRTNSALLAYYIGSSSIQNLSNGIFNHTLFTTTLLFDELSECFDDTPVQ